MHSKSDLIIFINNTGAWTGEPGISCGTRGTFSLHNSQWKRSAVVSRSLLLLHSFPLDRPQQWWSGAFCVGLSSEGIPQPELVWPWARARGARDSKWRLRRSQSCRRLSRAAKKALPLTNRWGVKRFLRRAVLPLPCWPLIVSIKSCY